MLNCPFHEPVSAKNEPAQMVSIHAGLRVGRASTRGGHAFNMGNRSKLNTLSDWPQRMTDWMQDNFILDPTGFDEYQKEVDENRQRMQRFLQRQRDRSAQP